MRNLTTAATFGVVIAIAAVFVGVYAMNDQATSMSSSNAQAYVTGHLTWIVKDADGNIKSYQQSDNLIVNRGENCALSRLFANNTVNPVGGCALSTTNSFNVVAVSNSNGTVVDTDTSLLTGAGLATNFNATAGLGPKKAETVVLTPASGTTAAKAVITAIFTNTDPATKTITKAGLLNSTAIPSALFAAQNLPSAIFLAQNNQLTVEWTINVGGTAGFT
jgi:hypothetical protein